MILVPLPKLWIFISLAIKPLDLGTSIAQVSKSMSSPLDVVLPTIKESLITTGSAVKLETWA